ncbi:esophageal gland cell secretory protein 21 [Stylonychia lemnae]|uniref:Esophageal gland cell secretory protein 21 n=1 Tax=Stylonychia lemnae TaxID=5949 RepID=A0A078AV00_STYLE|nr:esophageal gland cell secretory protein 21 [Stylonychia lemnae]|eukprot:CDW86220.1 esophageal gland cell secretory protein 21 [Stylonychia lemnae]
MYVQTTYLNRTYLSALYQLMGVFPDNIPHHLDYEKYQICKEDYLSLFQRRQIDCKDKCLQHFLIHQVNATHDFLLHVDDENCPRFSLVKDIMKDSAHYKNITSWFLDNLGPRVRDITKWSNITIPKILVNVCGYLQWAHQDKLELNFDYTNEDLKHCHAVGDSKLYFKSYGANETWILGSFEFLKQLQEFIHILDHNEKSQNQIFWQKYFNMHFHQNLPKDKVPLFPKFIHYAAHAETLSLFTEGLGMHSPKRAQPGSALFIEFYRGDDAQSYVRFFIKNENEAEQFIKPSWQKNDKATTQELYDYILSIIYQRAHDENFIEKQCENLNYDIEQHSIYSPEKALNELIQEYQLYPNSYQSLHAQNIQEQRIRHDL